MSSVAGKYYLGRKVVDNYGRTLGKVVGYHNGEKGAPPLLGVEKLEGDFNIYPSTQLIDEANILVLDENWRTKAEALSEGLGLSARKLSALEKLYKAGEINSDAYENLGKDFDSTLQDLKTRRVSLIEKLSERSKMVSVRLKEVEDYFVNVKVAHELGEVDDEAYRVSRDALHDLINRLQTEQKDIKAAEENLQPQPVAAIPHVAYEKTENPEKQAQYEPPEAQEPPAETPIVLRIKEAEE